MLSSSMSDCSLTSQTDKWIGFGKAGEFIYRSDMVSFGMKSDLIVPLDNWEMGTTFTEAHDGT